MPSPHAPCECKCPKTLALCKPENPMYGNYCSVYIYLLVSSVQPIRERLPYILTDSKSGSKITKLMLFHFISSFLRNWWVLFSLIAFMNPIKIFKLIDHLY